MGNVPRLLLAKMGGILGFAMEMTRRGSVAIPKPEIVNRNPPAQNHIVNSRRRQIDDQSTLDTVVCRLNYDAKLAAMAIKYRIREPWGHADEESKLI